MTAMTKEEERELAKRLVEAIGRMAEGADHKLRFMEVCGTHTVAIFRAGLRQMQRMAVVKRVVFADDAADAHGGSSFWQYARRMF